jgi:cytochrome c-type biogenesis protein CcmF
MASESAFSIETLAALSPGETRQVGPYALTLDRIDPVAGPNWTALQATVSARYAGGGRHAHAAGPRLCQSAGHAHRIRAENALERPALCGAGEEAQDGRWQMRFWWKPFVPLIWLGGLLVGLGGFLALIGRVARDVKRGDRQDRLPPRKAGR